MTNKKKCGFIIARMIYGELHGFLAGMLEARRNETKYTKHSSLWKMLFLISLFLLCCVYSLNMVHVLCYSLGDLNILVFWRKPNRRTR